MPTQSLQVHVHLMVVSAEFAAGTLAATAKPMMASVMLYFMFFPKIPVSTLIESTTRHKHHATGRRKYPRKLH